MARSHLLTYQDLVEHARDYLTGNASAEAGRDARRAVTTALAKLATAHRWTYYFQRYRLSLVAPYSTGTVTYTHTGGLYERVLTLASGTWPSWAAFGTVMIDSVLYEVSERKSNSAITLSVNSNPGEDVAAGSTYTIYRDTYPLPVDFLALGPLVITNRSTILTQEHPSAWMQRQQLYRGPGTPTTYCIRSDPNYQNTLALSFFPAPDAAMTIDGMYQRKPRELAIEEYSAGTVTTTSGSATVTGSGTAWTSRLAGTVFRVHNNRTEYPTGRNGDFPPTYERVVLSVDSATSITLDDLVDETFTAVKYTMSDPVDIETNTMVNAMLRLVEMQLGVKRRMEDRMELERLYRTELILAREADSRSFADSRAGSGVPYRVRLADMPRGSDIP